MFQQWCMLLLLLLLLRRMHTQQTHIQCWETTKHKQIMADANLLLDFFRWAHVICLNYFQFFLNISSHNKISMKFSLGRRRQTNKICFFFLLFSRSGFFFLHTHTHTHKIIPVQKVCVWNVQWVNSVRLTKGYRNLCCHGTHAQIRTIFGTVVFCIAPMQLMMVINPVYCEIDWNGTQ